jgi:general stress protein 26
MKAAPGPAEESFDRLVDGFETAMLVTRSLASHLRARPMAIVGHDHGGRLFFASRPEDEKLDEIQKNPDIAVTMQKPGCYLSLTGRAQIENDTNLAQELWSPSMKLWFPGGPEDSALTLIRFDTERGEYWDRSGVLRLEFLWEAGRALIKGEMLDEDRLSGHGKVGLGN